MFSRAVSIASTWPRSTVNAHSSPQDQPPDSVRSSSETQARTKPKGKTLSIRIRPEAAEDVRSIHRVVAAAFGREAEADLVDLLRSRAESELSLVATEDLSVVGHVLLSAVTLDPAPQPRLSVWGLAPLSVAPSAQNQGVGSHLMKAAIAEAKSRGVDALVLLGHPEYYTRFGFSTTHLGNEYGATKSFMALELSGGCLNNIEATARYVASFGEVVFD